MFKRMTQFYAKKKAHKEKAAQKSFLHKCMEDAIVHGDYTEIAKLEKHIQEQLDALKNT